MVHFYPEVKVGYTRIVTISTDNLLRTNEFRDGEGAQWPFLSDPERVVQRDLDIQEYTDPTNDPMIPHTLVLEPELRVRPDWDISSSECGRRGNVESVIGFFHTAKIPPRGATVGTCGNC